MGQRSKEPCSLPAGEQGTWARRQLSARRTLVCIGTLILADLVSSPLEASDRLVTSDARVLVVEKARQLPDGSYVLDFEHGQVSCPARFVASVEIEGDMSDYVPKNEDEREKLARGYVRYEGKWMSKPAYGAQLKREAEDRRARTKELAAHCDFGNAWEKETDHFLVRTNTSPELLGSGVGNQALLAGTQASAFGDPARWRAQEERRQRT